jgi:hypothetical protein
LVGYLEAVTDGLIIDLITVELCGVGEHRVLVPQRVDPERAPDDDGRPPRPPVKRGTLFEGPDAFLASTRMRLTNTGLPCLAWPTGRSDWSERARSGS